MRELLEGKNTTKKRKRPSREEEDTEGTANTAAYAHMEQTPMNIEQLLLEMDQESAWEYFLIFSNVFTDDLLRRILPGVSSRHETFQLLRERALSNCRHFQNRMIKAAKVNDPRHILVEHVLLSMI
jgi:hypothetical protein